VKINWTSILIVVRLTRDQNHYHNVVTDKGIFEYLSQTRSDLFGFGKKMLILQ